MAKFEHKKSLGQHFLTSDVVPGWMCDAAKLEGDDSVLEIGPGTGVLTKEILARGASVIALEADKRALAVLEKEFAAEITSGQLRLEHKDVRTLDLNKLSLTQGEYKVVANIPYYLSGLLFRTFLETTIHPKSLVFLVQKEVAERIACLRRGRGRQAQDKKESLLSLSVKAFGTPSYVKTVGKGHFNPPPKIDSAIILVENISQTNFVDCSCDYFFKLLHLGFGEKRKQLLGNLAKKYDREELANTFSTLGIRPDIRAEDLALSDWLSLTKALSPD